MTITEAYRAGYNRGERALQGQELLVKPGLVPLPSWIMKNSPSERAFRTGYQDAIRGRPIFVER